MSRGFASNYRLVLLAVGIVGCFAGVGVRLVHLHVIDREELMAGIEKARRQIVVEHARRGDILDRNGSILATSRSMIVLGVDPQVLRPEDEAKWPELAQMIGIPLGKLTQVFQTKTRPVKIKSGPKENPDAEARFAIFDPTTKSGADAAATGDEEDDTEVEERVVENGEQPIRWVKLSEGVTETVYAKIQELGIKGVYGNRVYRRAYPHKTLAAHIVGFVNKADVPAAGIENYADFYLRGRDGWREGERDGKGREVAQFRTREVPAADGYSVTLSIDATIQHIVEQELAYIAATYAPEKATIIVSDPQTGFILALGNYPTFDLNAYNKIPKREQHVMRNVAITDIYEPGSVFKIVAASAAENEGMIKPGMRFDCSITHIDYLGKSRSLPGEDHRFDEPLAVAEIVSKSSNRGAVQLALLVGQDKFVDYARAFGFGQLTGFPTGGEEDGILAVPGGRGWDGLTITRMPIGHSVSATPLQMHMAMGVIASGGMLLRPQVIREVRDAGGEVVYRYGPAAKHRVISEATARTMRKYLQGVPVDGTGKAAAIANYEVAGKTGSTQKIIDGRYSSQHHVASFVGFFPASRPQVAISVIIDDADPLKGRYASGGLVAAPSFKRIGEQLIQYLDIKPVYSEAGGSNIVMGGVHR